MRWGSPSDGWNALKDLPPDSVAAEAWSEFAKRAEAEDRWTIAREALESALRWKRTPEIAIRAAHRGDECRRRRARRFASRR